MNPPLENRKKPLHGNPGSTLELHMMLGFIVERLQYVTYLWSLAVCRLFKDREGDGDVGSMKPAHVCVIVCVCVNIQEFSANCTSQGDLLEFWHFG